MPDKLTLRQLRAGTKMTQNDVADKVGISRVMYNMLEQLDGKTLKAIADLYHVKPEDINLVD